MRIIKTKREQVAIKLALSYDIFADTKLRYHTLDKPNVFRFFIFEFIQKFSYKVNTAMCRLLIVEISGLLLLCQRHL
jgi:hypothetical protein